MTNTMKNFKQNFKNKILFTKAIQMIIQLNEKDAILKIF